MGVYKINWEIQMSFFKKVLARLDSIEKKLDSIEKKLNMRVMDKSISTDVNPISTDDSEVLGETIVYIPINRRT